MTTITIDISELNRLKTLIGECQKQIDEANTIINAFSSSFGAGETIITKKIVPPLNSSIKILNVGDKLDIDILSKDGLIKELKKHNISPSEIKRSDGKKGAPLIGDLKSALKKAITKAEKRANEIIVPTPTEIYNKNPVKFIPEPENGYAVYKKKYIAPLSVTPFKIMGTLDKKNRVRELDEDDVKKIEKMGIEYSKISKDELKSLLKPTTIAEINKTTVIREDIGEDDFSVEDVELEPSPKRKVHSDVPHSDIENVPSEKIYADQPVEGVEEISTAIPISSTSEKEPISNDGERITIEGESEKISKSFNEKKPNISDVSKDDYTKIITAAGGLQKVAGIKISELSAKSGVPISKIYVLVAHLSELSKKYGTVSVLPSLTPTYTIKPNEKPKIQRAKIGGKK